MNFKYVRNKAEYLLFVEQRKSSFDYLHDWEDFFGIRYYQDSEHLADITVCPPDYPAFIYCNFIDTKPKFPVRSIDFLPVSQIINSKYKNWCHNLNMVINDNILVDGVQTLTNQKE